MTKFLCLWILFTFPIYSFKASSIDGVRIKPPSDGSLDKSDSMGSLARAILQGKNRAKIIPTNDDLIEEPTLKAASSQSTLKLSSSFSLKLLPQKPSVFTIFHLPESIVQVILEYLYRDYRVLRLVCKESCRNFDELMYHRVVMTFLECRSFISEYFQAKKYKLIKLSEIIFDVLNRFPQERSTFLNIKGLHPSHDPNFGFRSRGLMFIKYLRLIHMDKAFKAISVLLKAKIICWGDVEEMFRNGAGTYPVVYSLGLLTIAKQLILRRPSFFLKTIGQEHGGILTVLKNRHYAFARFLIEAACDCVPRVISSNPVHLNAIIDEIINAQYWDLLETIYLANTSFDYTSHLYPLAKRGSVTGLRILQLCFRMHPGGIAHSAASHGHLNFLKELDRMGILGEAAGPNGLNETAIHFAALNGHVDCLSFLVETLGRGWLDLANDSGFMPIHMAAKSHTPETLRLIIRLYPRYRPRNPFKTLFKESLSPLQVAVRANKIESAQILLESFPELVTFRESKKFDRATILHMAAIRSNLEMLELLLEHSPSWLIRSLDMKRNNILHVACASSDNFSIISFIISINMLSLSQRNAEGLTPVGIFVRRNPLCPTLGILHLFSITLELFGDLVICKPPKLFPF